MANWLTIKRASEKYGIAESVVRQWKVSGYIVFSTIEDVVMLDEASLVRCLNIYKEEGVRQDSSDRLIREKELEREMILSALDDVTFLLETQSSYQPLFHTLIEELSRLINNNWEREIFLAVSSRQPIFRIAQQYQMSCDRVRETYESIFDKLAVVVSKIPFFSLTTMERFKQFANSDNPLDASLKKILPARIAQMLRNNGKITTVGELLQYTDTHGWFGLQGISGVGKRSFEGIIWSLEAAHYIAIYEDRKSGVSVRSFFIQ